MKLSFRQGIARALDVSGSPSFLSYNSGQSTVDINITSVKLLVTAAYKEQNFLIEHPADQTSVWGPFTWNTTAWGTEPGVHSYWLYWDINLADGTVTTGYTPYFLVVSATQPTTGPDKHWWDSTNNVLKVWNGTFWIEKCRVFAGSFNPSNQSLTHCSFYSQVGLNADLSTHGYVVLGNDGRALVDQDGFLVTSETNLMVKQGGYSSPVRLEGLSTTMLAAEPLPAFSAVTVSALGEVSLADSVTSSRAIGLVTLDITQGSPTTVVTEGMVFNEQWNWDLDQGKEILLGVNGTLVQGSVEEGVPAQRIGMVMTAQSIVLTLDDFISTASGSGSVLEQDVEVIGTSVGAIDAGYTFLEGTTFTEFVMLISQRTLPPTYTAPTLALASSPSPTGTEVGTILSPQLTQTFSQNNAGSLLARRLNKNASLISTATPYTDASIQLTLSPIVYQAEVDYGQGPVLNNNMGQPDPTGRINAGTVVSNSITFIGHRAAFYGTPVSTPGTSSAVRALTSTLNCDENSGVDAAGVALIASPTPNWIITIPIGATRVVFAYPADRRAVASVKYQELSDSEVKGNFTMTTVSVEGANGYSPVNYRVYTYVPVEPFSIVNHYKVFI